MTAYMHSQRGVTLIVALVILLVLTLLGVSAIDTSDINLKVATGDKNRQVVFQATEATLRIAEQEIESIAPNDVMLQDCASGDDSCYDDTCAGGMCFNGTYVAGADQYDCALSDASPPATPVWRSPAPWNNANMHRTATVNEMDNEPKYIVEFLCFVERGDGSVFDSSHPNNGAPLFRVTALAESDDGKGRVMLQSTYRYVD